MCCLSRWSAAPLVAAGVALALVACAPPPLPAQQPMSNAWGVVGTIGSNQEVQGKLTQMDARWDNRPLQAYQFSCQAGQSFRMDVFSVWDNYALVFDPMGNVAARDDDSGDGLNASITYTCTMSGVYRLAVTTFTVGTAPGPYALQVTGIGAAMPLPDSMPQRIPLPPFPWPPPVATTRDVVPRGLVTRPAPAGAEGSVDTLGGVADSIESALRRGGIRDHAVYFIGDSGFVYVTRAEMIQPTGAPYPGDDRFPTDLRTASGSQGFLEFIVSRFRARPGYFRIIAIIVTSRPIVTGGAPLSLDSATVLVNGGALTVPGALRRRAVRDLQVEAHVYEYLRPTASDTVGFRAASPVGARRHLAAAGLWTLDQLGGMR